MTKDKESSVYFAPFPLRALSDQSLTALDLRALGTIAYHDRLSGPRGKGQGAWASLATYAARTKCHYTNMSTTLTKLVAKGYLSREKHPLNGRMNVYRVVYGESDSLPSDKLSPVNEDATSEFLPNVGQSTNHNAATVGELLKNTEQYQLDDDAEYISLSDIKNIGRAAEILPVNERAGGEMKRANISVIQPLSVKQMLTKKMLRERAAPISPRTAPNPDIESLMYRFEKDLRDGCDELNYQEWYEWLIEVSRGEHGSEFAQTAGLIIAKHDWTGAVIERISIESVGPISADI